MPYGGPTPAIPGRPSGIDARLCNMRTGFRCSISASGDRPIRQRCDIGQIFHVDSACKSRAIRYDDSGADNIARDVRVTLQQYFSVTQYIPNQLPGNNHRVSLNVSLDTCVFAHCDMLLVMYFCAFKLAIYEQAIA